MDSAVKNDNKQLVPTNQVEMHGEHAHSLMDNLYEPVKSTIGGHIIDLNN